VLIRALEDYLREGQPEPTVSDSPTSR